MRGPSPSARLGMTDAPLPTAQTAFITWQKNFPTFQTKSKIGGVLF
ncbi:MAG TPA: hypothetical protein VF345_11480 [Chthoniobacterales bacterium]